MIFLYIYIGFSLLTFVLMWTQTVILTRRLEKKHKDLVDKKQKDLLATFFAAFKMFLQSFIPILNLILFFSLLFLSDRIEKEVTIQVEDKLKDATYINPTKTN